MVLRVAGQFLSHNIAQFCTGKNWTPTGHRNLIPPRTRGREKHAGGQVSFRNGEGISINGVAEEKNCLKLRAGIRGQ